MTIDFQLLSYSCSTKWRKGKYGFKSLCNMYPALTHRTIPTFSKSNHSPWLIEMGEKRGKGRKYQSLGVFMSLFILKTGRVVSGWLRKARAFSVYYCRCHLNGMSKATLKPATIFYHLKQRRVGVHPVLHIIGKMEWIQYGN